MNGRLHHVGYVLPSIRDGVEPLRRSLGTAWDGVIVHDPLQSVNVAFLPSRDGPGPVVELIEPAGRRSPVRKFAESGGGLHHLCYEVPDLPERIRASQAAGDVVVRVPLPARAFDNRRIVFVRTSGGLLLEFLEAAGRP
jgi:methylmalonyl-CoA/ethylmalonyl-CoA epimerase